MKNIVRIRKQFTAEECKICGMGKSYCIFTAEGAASVEVRVKEKTFYTKSEAEYVVSRKEYALVVCQNPEINFGDEDGNQNDMVPESFENVESFDAYFYFIMPGGEKEEHKISNIEPVRIDLDGDWIFNISDKDGEKLCHLNNKAMMRH